MSTGNGNMTGGNANKPSNANMGGNMNNMNKTGGNMNTTGTGGNMNKKP
jgi:hypothetical protein